MQVTYEILFEAPLPQENESILRRAILDLMQPRALEHFNSTGTWRMRIFDNSGALIGDWGIQVTGTKTISRTQNPPAELLAPNT